MKDVILERRRKTEAGENLGPGNRPCLEGYKASADWNLLPELFV
ncbi:MAG TPA: hypothetical protein VF598_14285 [Hymenobacter sp.]